MIKELSCIRLKRPLPGRNIPVGSKGTVLIVYEASPPAYEVEFVDAHGDTIEDKESSEFTFTTDDEHIELLKEGE